MVSERKASCMVRQALFGPEACFENGRQSGILLGKAMASYEIMLVTAYTYLLS